MGAAKLPFIKFYPGDWIRDSVAGCSLAAQGLWLRLLFLMHDSERYGHLCQGGLPVPTDRICRLIGCSPDEYATLLAELKLAGVPSFTGKRIMYSRRMEKDAEDRADMRERKAKSRANTKHLKGNGHNLVTDESHDCPGERSEVRSQRSEVREHTEAAGAPGEARCVSPPPPDFDASEIAKRIWQRHPAHRRGSLQATERAFAQRLMGAMAPAAVAADVDRRHAGWCASRQWREGAITGLTKWLTSDDPGCCLTEPPPPAGEFGPVDVLTFGAKREQRMVKRFLDRVAQDVG